MRKMIVLGMLFQMAITGVQAEVVNANAVEDEELVAERDRPNLYDRLRYEKRRRRYRRKRRYYRCNPQTGVCVPAEAIRKE